MPTSYNNWEANDNPAAIGVNRKWEPLPGIKFPGGIKSGDVETVFTYLVIQLNNRVERADLYAAGDEWGYAYRDNRNKPGQLSCHASATAIDYNATRHPNKVKNTWTWPQVAEIRKIVDDELEGVIRWLHGWDEMHFEIRGNAAAVKRVADKLRTQGKEPFTMAQYDDIMNALKSQDARLKEIEVRINEFDDDVPENLDSEIDLIRKGIRALGAHFGVDVGAV